MRLRDVRRRQPLLASERPTGAHYALVVGVDRYRPPLQPLTNAVKDATAVAERLSDEFGFQVTFLRDHEATAAAILATLEGWSAATQPEDQGLLFFAGHGESLRSSDDSIEGFLLPSDASKDPATWLSEVALVQHAKRLPARHVLLVFDACYAGTTFRHDIPSGARDDQVLKALVAGTEDQPVLDGGAGDHSIFTRALLDGLDGWAASGRIPDDIVSADELIVYVESEVPWRSRLRHHEQNPIGGALQGYRTAVDFEFRPVKPRLPAPVLRNLYSPAAEDRVAAAAQLGNPASTDTADVRALKVRELVRLMEHDDVDDVRTTAAGSLGQSGHADALQPLVLAVSEARPGPLPAAAALALGSLGLDLETEALKAASIRALIQALEASDSALVEAAKAGLGLIPQAGAALREAFERGRRGVRRHLLDALACLANTYPDDDRAWPGLPTIASRLQRRGYLVRRRLNPRWPELRRRMVRVGVAGALGLSLAYLILILGNRPLNPYAPAVFSYNLLPGALAGVGLVLSPALASGLARHPGRRTDALGGLLGGAVLGLGLALPNWFLGVGREPRAWLLPGLICGPLLGLAIVLLERGENTRAGPGAAAARGPGGFVAVAPLLALGLIGGLSFALVRLPESLAWGSIGPRGAELVRWGLGGAVFGLALALGRQASGTSHRLESHE